MFINRIIHTQTNTCTYAPSTAGVSICNLVTIFPKLHWLPNNYCCIARHNAVLFPHSFGWTMWKAAFPNPWEAAQDYVHRIGRTGRAGMKGSMESMVSKDHRTVDSGENLIGPYQHLNIFRSMIVVGHWPCFDRFEVLYLKFKCSNPENGPVKVLAGTVSDGNIYIYIYILYIYIFIYLYCIVYTVLYILSTAAVTARQSLLCHGSKVQPSPSCRIGMTFKPGRSNRWCCGTSKRSPENFRQNGFKHSTL